MSEALFKDFAKISAEEWAEKLENDLKDKSIDSLMWKTQGLSGKPFYTALDLDTELHDYTNTPENFKLFGSRFWVNYQTVKVQDTLAANQTAIFALAHGASGIIFELENNESLEILLKDIQPQYCHLGFRLSDKVEIEEFEKDLQSFLVSNEINSADVNGFVESTAGNPSAPSFKSQVVYFSNSENLCLSLAKELSIFIDEIDRQCENIDQVKAKLNNTLFVLNTQNDFFLEIARQRAVRRLIDTLSNGYGIQSQKVEFLSKIGPWTNAIEDPHSFMLHATTQCMSAILGGSDAVSVLPFENVFKGKPSLADRVARNISSILSEESYLSKMTDPAKGSYYIEHLTTEIYARTLSMIQGIEAEGGYSKIDVSKLEEVAQ